MGGASPLVMHGTGSYPNASGSFNATPVQPQATALFGAAGFTGNLQRQVDRTPTPLRAPQVERSPTPQGQIRNGLPPHWAPEEIRHGKFMSSAAPPHWKHTGLDRPMQQATDTFSSL